MPQSASRRREHSAYDELHPQISTWQLAYLLSESILDEHAGIAGLALAKRSPMLARGPNNAATCYDYRLIVMEDRLVSGDTIPT